MARFILNGPSQFATCFPSLAFFLPILARWSTRAGFELPRLRKQLRKQRKKRKGKCGK
jgi:hypothetical protein